MALSFFKKKDCIALDVGSNAIKLIALKQSKKGWELQKMGIAYLPPEAIVDGSIIDSMTVTDTIIALLKEHKVTATDTISALTSHSVIIKKVPLPAMTEEELGESIQWEAEQHIPFPMSEVYIDFQILGEDTEGTGQMDVMLGAVKRDVILEYTNVLKEAGLHAVVVDVDSFALENMMEISYSLAPNENVAMINIGASITSISVIADGVTAFTRRSDSGGGNQLTEEIQRHFNISFSEAEDAKLGKGGGVDPEELAQVMGTVSHSISMEVKRSIDFYLSGAPGMVVNKIILSGGGAKVKGLLEIMQEETGIPVEIVNPFGGLVYNPKSFDEEQLQELGPYFGVAVGLGTRRLGDR